MRNSQITWGAEMPEFSIVTVEPQPILYVHRSSSTDPEAIGACMTEAFGALVGFVEAQGIAMTGPPMSIYHGFGETEATFDVAIAVSAADAERAAGHADIKGGATHAGRALKAVHVGPYNRLVDTYGQVMAHMETEKITPKAPSWERYMNDPSSTPEAELVTEIYFPVD